MGYESNFEVPDIDDRILRGVDDLTDLNCPSIDDFNHQYHGTFTYSFTCDYFFFPVVRSRCREGFSHRNRFAPFLREIWLCINIRTPMTFSASVKFVDNKQTRLNNILYQYINTGRILYQYRQGYRRRTIERDKSRERRDRRGNNWGSPRKGSNCYNNNTNNRRGSFHRVLWIITTIIIISKARVI